MSFTTEIKDEIAMKNFSHLENIAELSAYIRVNAKIMEDFFELTTENAKIAKRYYTLIKDLYGVSAEITKRDNKVLSKNNIYVVKIVKNVNIILKNLSIIDDNNNFIEIPRDYLVDSDAEMRAYLRGVFLAKGSINDPKTSMYHLEFSFDNKHDAVFVQRILNNFNLNSKIILRDVKYMVYIKDSEKISDFLKVINASKAVLYYENIKINKEQKNNTNRLNNCEQANIDRLVEAANRQVNEIEKISSVLGFDFLDQKLKETCIYRLKYPEASLDELSKIITLETGNSVSKSGLNHRFRKIKQIFEKIK